MYGFHNSLNFPSFCAGKGAANAGVTGRGAAALTGACGPPRAMRAGGTLPSPTEPKARPPVPTEGVGTEAGTGTKGAGG